MENRIINIRVMFVAFCGLMVGILFSIYNTFQNFGVLKTILFIAIIIAISLFLFFYGFFTRKRNSLYRARKKVSGLLMASGVAFLITTIIGVLVTLYPYAKVLNLPSYSSSIRIEGVVCDYVSDNTTHTKFIIKDCLIESEDGYYECHLKQVL